MDGLRPRVDKYSRSGASSLGYLVKGAVRGFVADVGTKFPLIVDVCNLLGNKRAFEWMLCDDFSEYFIIYSIVANFLFLFLSVSVSVRPFRCSKLCMSHSLTTSFVILAFASSTSSPMKTRAVTSSSAQESDDSLSLLRQIVCPCFRIFVSGTQ